MKRGQRPISFTGGQVALRSIFWFRQCASDARPATEGTCIKSVLSTFKDKRHYFVHAGNMLVLCAINQTDMMNLRALSIVASTLGIAYNLLQPTPLWAPGAWGLFFISCHAFYMIQLLRERQHIVLTEDQEEIYERAFMRFGFTPRQFCDLLEKSHVRWCTFSKDVWLFKRTDPWHETHFLIEGEATVYTATGDVLRTATPGRGGWLGEFYDPHLDKKTLESNLQQSHCFSVRCKTETCRTMALSRQEMYAHVNSDKKLQDAATRSQVDDLWGKLRKSIPEARRSAYRQMLEVALSDGVLEPQERELLTAWWERHEITDAEHKEMLGLLGWSEAEFAKGRKIK